MAVDKITSPISELELIEKTNEIIDNLVAVNVDTSLSTTSTNPVQNKVITSALNEKVNTSDYVAYTASEIQALWSSI